MYGVVLGGARGLQGAACRGLACLACQPGSQGEKRAVRLGKARLGEARVSPVAALTRWPSARNC